MKISKIEKIDYQYRVTLSPNWLERLFGVKEKVWTFRDSGSTYTFGGGTCYTRSDGKQTGNGSWIAEAIDIWRRKF